MVSSCRPAYFVPTDGHLPFPVFILKATADPRRRCPTMITTIVPGHGTDSVTAPSPLRQRHWCLSNSQMSYRRSHRHAPRRRASSASSPSRPSSPRDSHSSPSCSTALYTCATFPTRNKSQRAIRLTTGRRPPRFMLATPTPSQPAPHDAAGPSSAETVRGISFRSSYP